MVVASIHCRKAGDYYAAFFAQQAAEKAPKALLSLQGYRAILAHSVVDVLRGDSSLCIPPGAQGAPGREPDRPYMGRRYPNFSPAGGPHCYYSNREAERCVSYAASISEAVKSSFAG
ncbi:hypothetical protein HRbin23_00403 [bacterium HR23]|nr:hypothetical protein HRbin23_00403 [bacterium HR23]